MLIIFIERNTILFIIIYYILLYTIFWLFITFININVYRIYIILYKIYIIIYILYCIIEYHLYQKQWKVISGCWYNGTSLNVKYNLSAIRYTNKIIIL